MDRIDEINAHMLEQFKVHRIEDTHANRLAFLMGMQSSWRWDVEDQFEKTFYQMALNAAIFHQKMMLTFA